MFDINIIQSFWTKVKMSPGGGAFRFGFTDPSEAASLWKLVWILYYKDTDLLSFQSRYILMHGERLSASEINVLGVPNRGSPTSGRGTGPVPRSGPHRHSNPNVNPLLNVDQYQTWIGTGCRSILIPNEVQISDAVPGVNQARVRVLGGGTSTGASWGPVHIWYRVQQNDRTSNLIGTANTSENDESGTTKM